MVDAPKPEAPKPALKKSLDDDDSDKPKKLVKPGARGGRGIGRGIIIGTLILTLGWTFASLTQPRYTLLQVQSNENSFLYRLDQRTGTVHFCNPAQCVEVPVKEAGP
ncbi:MAG: hypothetical protein JNK21_11430 [Rhodospirillaceae bacterium]|nr:hypothetical protein [Rhodospirillaceae bacterium]